MVEEGAQRLSRNPSPQEERERSRRGPGICTLPHVAWTYILECADGSYYVGSTTHLESRLWQHSHSPDGAEYTRKRRPVTLVWSGEFTSVAAAFAFEKRVQGWSRAKRRALIEGRFTDLPGLASRSDAALRARFRDGR